MDMLEAGLYTAIAPLILLLVSSVWQYPAVLEEVVKWGIMRWSMVNGQWSLKAGALVGLMFGLSEAVLFSLNAWTGGDWRAIGLRLLLTVPMHTVTGGVIGWGLRGNGQWSMVNGQWIGLAAAMVIHAGFNYWVR